MPPERLSIYDAIFYYTDNRHAAMEASACMLVDGPVDFDRYLEWVTPRVDRAPRMRKWLKPSPFALRRPAWIASTEFDTRDHVLSHRLEAPGNDDQLRLLIEELMHQRMSRDKPLWRLHVINGIDNKHTALLFRFHHCMADAEGALEILGVLLDSAGPENAQPKRVSKAGLARHAHARRPLHSLRSLLSHDGRRRLALLADYARKRGPRFPFTRPVSGRLRIAWRIVPLNDVRAISAAFGTTATDVALAMLGSAIDAYAEEHQIDVRGKHLLFQVPANVRLPDKYGELGNELTMLPGVVPLGVHDPVERLRRVAEYNRTLKEQDMAAVIHGLMGTAFGVATPLGQALFCKTMVARPYLRMARMIGLPPQEHGLMSSIVVPPLGYSIDGQRVTAFINLIACQFNMGFALSPVAYGEMVTLGLTVDAVNFGDANGLMGRIVDALDDLLRRADTAAQA